MDTISLLPEVLDDDSTRLQKLLAWAKSKKIWINDAVNIAEMQNERCEQSAHPETENLADGKRKKREFDRNDSHDKPKRVFLDSSSLRDDTIMPVKAEGAELDERIVMNSNFDDDEKDYDERARGQGFGVYIRAGGRVLKRQVSMLSARTSSLSPHIPSSMLFSSDASSGLLLTLVLIHEYLLGQNSQWWGFLQSLPRQNGKWGIKLPLSENKKTEEREGMEKTEVGRMLRRVEADPEGMMEGLGMSLVGQIQK